MTKEEIITAIKYIKRVSEDDEASHSKEDALREAFIRSIAKRNDSLGEKARLVLSTNELTFARWRST